MLPYELTGITGWAADLIDRAGVAGVGLLTLFETVFPPIPSEVILPLAGYLSQQGAMNIVLVGVCSTAGAYLGALLLYGLGAALGWDRSAGWLSRLTLLDRADIYRAGQWFSRHCKSAVFFSRLIPSVRSLISLPAAAQKMNLLTFSVFTIAGSGRRRRGDRLAHRPTHPPQQPTTNQRRCMSPP